MTVILDSGSTTLLIAEALNRKSNITVITNSLPLRLRYRKTKTLRWSSAAARCVTKLIQCMALSLNVPFKG